MVEVNIHVQIWSHHNRTSIYCLPSNCPNVLNCVLTIKKTIQFPSIQQNRTVAMERECLYFMLSLQENKKSVVVNSIPSSTAFFIDFMMECRRQGNVPMYFFECRLLNYVYLFDVVG